LSSAALDRTFAALSDPTRRGVVDLLRAEPRRAGDLAQELAVTPPALSRHLRLLRQSGLVEEAALPGDGRVRLYRLCPEPFADLRGWLDQVESFWSGQLAAFKAHAEDRRPRRLPRPGQRGHR
jgi:DNA-binding transcriptional ArsR family regulator